MTAGPPPASQPPFRTVVVVGGHLVDQAERTEPRFPPSAEPRVTEAIADVFASWRIEEGSLVISGAARGGDIIAAEEAQRCGATVWLLVALPDQEFVDASVRVADTDWEARYRALRTSCPTWFQPDVLGAAATPEAAFARNNRWMLEVGEAQSPTDELKVVAVWDGRSGDGPGGTADLVRDAAAVGARVEIIDPLVP